MQVIEILVIVLAVLILDDDDDDDAVRGLQPLQHALRGANHGVEAPAPV